MADEKITNTDIEFARKETIQQCIARLNIQESVQIGGFELSSKSKVIIDTPFRDNSIWTGDLFAAGPSAAKYVEGGMEAWRNSLLVIAYKQYPNGKLPSCATITMNYRGLSPFFDTYAMFWVVSAYDYLKKSSDKQFEKLFVQVLKKSLNYFNTRLTGDGLYKTPPIDMYWNWTILRAKKSTHANALFFRVTQIAEEFGLDVPISSAEIAANFNSYFWTGRLYKDRGRTTYLDGNSFALLFGMVPEERKKILFRSLRSFETPKGVLSSRGNPFTFTSWHKNIICPFLSYIHTLALQKEGKNKRAGRLMRKTLEGGLIIARMYGKETIPEFWKKNGKLGARPILGKRRFIGLSLNADWSAFGDLQLS